MCVVNYPMEILTPVRQRFVDIVHGLCQRCKALGHLFQPGGRCTVLLRLGLPCLRLFFRLRHKPCCGHAATAVMPMQTFSRYWNALPGGCTQSAPVTQPPA